MNLSNNREGRVVCLLLPKSDIISGSILAYNLSALADSLTPRYCPAIASNLVMVNPVATLATPPKKLKAYVFIAVYLFSWLADLAIDICVWVNGNLKLPSSLVDIPYNWLE